MVVLGDELLREVVGQILAALEMVSDPSSAIRWETIVYPKRTQPVGVSRTHLPPLARSS
jgi:hypothetical protein